MKLKISNERHNNRIGIDLATRKIGVAVFIDGADKQVLGFSYELKNTNNWDKSFIEELEMIIGDKPEFYKNFEVYIEVGNFGSPLMTQKFACIAGIIWGLLHKQGCEVVHIIRPADWFNAFIKRNNHRFEIKDKQMERKDKKPLVIREIVKDIESGEVRIADPKLCTQDLADDDIADAYLIARYGNTCMHAFWDKPHKEKYKRKIDGKKKNNRNNRKKKA